MMKKLGKILLVMAMSLVLLIAMMTVASAAEITGVSASVATDAGRTITVTVEYSNKETPQYATVLVVPSDTALATLEDEQIKFIDQETVSENTVTYTFKLLEADRQGVYDVYVGGSGIDNPSDTSFSFDTRKIIGKVVVQGDATKATAVATPVAGGDGKSVNAASDGTYAIEVGQGTYNVVLGKAGYLYKTYEDVAVGTEDVSLGEVALIGGDFNNDNKVAYEDLQTVLNLYTQDSTACDLDDNGKIEYQELQTVLNNYTKTTDSYNTAE